MDRAELERSLVGQMVRDKNTLAAAFAAGLQTQHFETPQAREVYSIFLENCYDEVDMQKITLINTVAIKAFLEKRVSLNKTTVTPQQLPTYLRYIDSLKEADNDSPEFSIKWIMEYAEGKRMEQTLRDTMKEWKTSNNLEKATNHFIENFIASSTSLSSSIVPEDLEDGAIARWYDRQHRIAEGTAKPIAFGFPTIDEKMEGGSRYNETVIVIGYPGVGKSFFCDNLGINYFEAGLNVLKVTTENTKEQSIVRAESIYHNLNYRKLMNCDAEIKADELFMKQPRKNRHMTIRLFPGEHSATDLIRMIELMKFQDNFDPDVIIIDSPDFLKPPQVQNREQGARHHQLTNMYLQLKNYVELRHKLLLTTSHVKLQDYKGRRGGRKDRLDIGDLSDSSGKARLADTVITLNVSEELADLGQIEAYFAKIRDANQRPFSVLLQREFDSPRFTEVQ